MGGFGEFQKLSPQAGVTNAHEHSKSYNLGSSAGQKGVTPLGCNLGNLETKQRIAKAMGQHLTRCQNFPTACNFHQECLQANAP